MPCIAWVLGHPRATERQIMQVAALHPILSGHPPGCLRLRWRPGLQRVGKRLRAHHMHGQWSAQGAGLLGATTCIHRMPSARLSRGAAGLSGCGSGGCCAEAQAGLWTACHWSLAELLDPAARWRSDSNIATPAGLPVMLPLPSRSCRRLPPARGGSRRQRRQPLPLDWRVFVHSLKAFWHCSGAKSALCGQVDHAARVSPPRRGPPRPKRAYFSALRHNSMRQERCRRCSASSSGAGRPQVIARGCSGAAGVAQPPRGRQLLPGFMDTQLDL